MKINELISLLDLNLIAGAKGLEKTVTGGYVSDLLSDVIGNAREGNVWITLQTHQNIIAVASLKDVSAIIIVKGLKPDNDTIEKSNMEGIPLLLTESDTFNTSGRLFELLVKNELIPG